MRNAQWFAREQWLGWVLVAVLVTASLAYTAKAYIDCSAKGGSLIKGAVWPPLVCVRPGDEVMP